MYYRNSKAFTLIELIVVIAILAILAVALIPLINNFIEKSRISQLMTVVAGVETAATAFNADTAGIPTDFFIPLKDSEFVVDRGRVNWDGPYFSGNSSGVTPWGGQFFLSMSSGEVALDFSLLLLGELSAPNPESIARVPIPSMVEVSKKIDGSADLDAGRVQNRPGDIFGIIIIKDAFADVAPDNEANAPTIE